MTPVQQSASVEMPLVSAVIPNWNGGNYTIQCLQSLHALDYSKSSIEIIVADNGSTDDSPKAIQELFAAYASSGYAGLHLIELGENKGAAAAYNAAIRRSSPHAKYIWKLDNDVVVSPDSLKVMVERLEKDKGDVYGAVTGIFRNARTHHLEPIGTIPHTSYLRWVKIFEEIYPDPEWVLHGKEKANLWSLSGGSTLFRKKFLVKSGLFNENFFLYNDDIELGFRMYANGVRFLCLPNIQILHYGGSSTNSLPASRAYYWVRSHLLLGSLFFQGSERALFLFTQCLITPIKLIRMIVIHFPRAKYEAGRAVLKGWIDFLRGHFGKYT